MVSAAKIQQALEIEAEQIEAAVQLYQYQIDRMLDESRFKYGLWSRQAGKSFGSCLEAVDDCCINRTNWVFLSAGERQSKNLMLTAQLHAMAYGAA